MTTLELQRRLAASGFDPGPIDGVIGRLTIRAIKAFQQAHGLEVDGIVGPKTASMLTTEPGDPPKKIDTSTLTLPWMEIAEHLLGVTEGAGSKNNPAILQWGRDLDLAYSQDSIAWCGLFVAHCLSTALPDEVLPANPLGARNYLKFGTSCEPRFGAVLVFWRTDKVHSFNGHVGFYLAENKTQFRVRAGNQGDKVSDAWIAKSRLLGARCPKTAPFLMGGKVETNEGGELSTNEA